MVGTAGLEVDRGLTGRLTIQVRSLRHPGGMLAKSIRPVALRAGMVAVGLVIGVGLTSLLGLLWPWIVSLGVAGFGPTLRPRYPLLLWLALGVAGGALTYIVLAWR